MNTAVTTLRVQHPGRASAAPAPRATARGSAGRGDGSPAWIGTTVAVIALAVIATLVGAVLRIAVDVRDMQVPPLTDVVVNQSVDR